MEWIIKDAEDWILESRKERIFMNNNSDVNTRLVTNEKFNHFIPEGVHFGN